MIIQGSRALLIDKATATLADCVRGVLERKNQVVLALPGGSSVKDIFERLGRMDLPWPKVQILLLDERLVPPDHPDSNFLLVTQALGREAGARVSPFCTSPVAAEANLAAYNARLEELGGKLDIVVASSGEDGHIASLFPCHEALEDPQSRFLLVDKAPKPPPQRMSASAGLVRNAETGILLFFGQSKHKAFDRYRNLQISWSACPAKLMDAVGTMYLFTDIKTDEP